MASTMVALQSVTVGAGGAATVSFTSIPQTYTDLVVKHSARSTAIYAAVDVYINFNSVALGSQYAGLLLYGTGTASGSGSSSSSTWAGFINAGGSTASTFGNNEIYISNYASSNYKSVSVDGVSENNASEAYQELVANTWLNTAAITSLTLTPAYNSFAQYSTFTLYGVYNNASEAAPSVPTIGTATNTGASGTVNVTFTAGANTGAVYTATSTPSSITGSNNYSPILVSGLTDGTAYTFTVKAANPGGTSAESSASNSVTPLVSSYESIATTTVGAGGSSSITFSSIPSTYSHLQIRYIAKDGTSGNVGWSLMRVNSVSVASAYVYLTYVGGDGSTVSALASYSNSYIYSGNTAGASATSFGSGIIDILDYANTNKSKTIRILCGIDNNGSGNLNLIGGAYLQNTAISSLTITPANGNFAQYTTYALYGIK